MKPTRDSPDVTDFRDLIEARTGIAIPESRLSDLRRVFQRAAEHHDSPGSDAFFELLRAEADSGDAQDALMTALNVSETHFFRDAGQMQALERRILPDLIARRGTTRRLRLWSAGCSSGEEAYTLAILVTRLLSDLADWDVLILATDINGQSVARARRGVYGAWSLRATSPLTMSSYLTQTGRQFEVVPDIRAMVTFDQLNLVHGDYPSAATNTEAMDLVLCRNVLLYFDAESRRSVVGRLRDALSDGGRLLVSQVEAGLGVFDGLEQDPSGAAIYRKMKTPLPDLGGPWQDQASLPTPAEIELAVPAVRPRPPYRSPPVGADQAATAHLEALRLWRAGFAGAALERLDAVLESFPLAAHLHYLYGLILLDRQRIEDALAAFRRCTYADPDSALGHLAQAGLLARLGLCDRARTALENTARLVADLKPADLIVGGDGLTIGHVLELIAAQRALLLPPDAGDDSYG